MNIFQIEIKNNRKGVFITMISISAILLAMLLFFPSMATDSMQALANAKMEGIDPILLKALGISSLPDFTVITNYYGYILTFVTLAIYTIFVQQAAGLLIKEESEGTIEYLIAKPISRTRIFVEKLIFHVAYSLILLACFFAVSVIGYILVTDLSMGEILRENSIFYGSRIFIGLVYSSLGILASTLIPSSKYIIGCTVAIVFGSYFASIMSVIAPKLEFLSWFSPMNWIKSEKLMSEGILMHEWMIGIAVIIAAIGIALTVYKKKDLLV